MGEGELGTELSLLPKNHSGSGEVDSGQRAHSLIIFMYVELAEVQH